MAVVEASARRLPLAARNGFDAAAPDFAQERAGIERQRHAAATRLDARAHMLAPK